MLKKTLIDLLSGIPDDGEVFILSEGYVLDPTRVEYQPRLADAEGHVIDTNGTIWIRAELH